MQAAPGIMMAKNGEAVSEAIGQIRGVRPRRFRPYPEYKDSSVEWVGEIPTHWETKSLKRLFRVENGSTPKSNEPKYWDGDIPWITPEDLGTLNGRIITTGGRCITQSGFESCGTRLVPSGSLVLSTRAPIGHLGIAGSSLCTNQGCRSLVFREESHADFFYFSLTAARAVLEATGRGSTFKELAKEDLEAVALCVPEADEQHAIAAFLDRETRKIDRLLAKKELLIELLREKCTAVITQAVTRGLDPGVPVKDSGIEGLGEIPTHWEVRRLKFLLDRPLQYGANEPAELRDETLPRYIRITDVDEDGMLREETFRSIPEHVAKPYLLEDGDLLFARSGATVGKTFRYEPGWGRAAYAGYLIRARLDTEECDSRFLKYFTSSLSYWDWLHSNFIQATIQNVSAERYANLDVPLPRLEEQRRTVGFLDRETAKLDALITKVREAIDLLKEFRTALISAAVTGKIDVRDEAA